MKKLFAVLSAFLLTACCTACSDSAGTSGTSSAEASENDGKIAVICKSTDPYWDSVKKAVEDAQAELGMKIPYTAPDREDYEKQIELINKAVSNGAEVIVLAPVVQDELNDTLSEVIDKGVQVITIDSDVSLESRAAFLATNNEYAASLGGNHAKTLLDGDDDPVIAVLTHDVSSPTAIQRRDGFIDVLDTNTIQILDPVNCEGDIDKSKEAVIQIITDHPDIDIVYATNQPTTVGVCQGVQSLVDDGKIEKDQVKVIGFDYFDGADAYLDNGILSGVVIQHPYNMGYFGVKAANYLLNGEDIPVSMMDTGSALVTKDNLNDEEIQFMINPAG